MNNNTDIRQNKIEQWLNNVLEGKDFNVEVASSDASFRRYFRVTQREKSWIVMDAPPEHEDIAPFIKIAEYLFQNKINVPQIFAKNRELGFLLLSDLGNTALLSKLNDKNVMHLYQLAIDGIIAMQLSDLKAIKLPDYDTDLLQRELDLFPEWFLSRHLGLQTPECIKRVNELLIKEAQNQPYRFVHRDYHSRNLMLQNNKQLGIIDFQDAVNGPVTYDLVSLLKDCYVEWPEQTTHMLIEYYLEQAHQHGLFSDAPFSDFLRAFDFMGLQRHLKVLGIFCRLYYRDGKEGYLKDLPLTLRYVLNVTQRYPELAELHHFLTESESIMAIQ